jgi:hypothetical protein
MLKFNSINKFKLFKINWKKFLKLFLLSRNYIIKLIKILIKKCFKKKLMYLNFNKNKKIKININKKLIKLLISFPKNLEIFFIDLF